MKYKLKVYSIQEFGQRKDAQGNPHQEDSMYPAFGHQTDADRTFILCDGMGGHDAGEVASATVCEEMSRSILNDRNDKEGNFTDQDFQRALNAAFEALDEKDSGAEKKMGTTMTFLKLHDEGAFIAHIGDSRVYHIRPGKNGQETKILFQTIDHSLINDLIRIGELTKDEARTSPQKNVITRAMQPHMDRRPKADIHKTSDIKAGDYFYMCSDGMLEDPDMEEGTTLRNIFSEMGGDDEKKVKILTKVTKDNKDNHTAFIIHIIEVKDAVKATDKANNAIDSEFAAIVEEDEEAFAAPASRMKAAAETTAKGPESIPNNKTAPKKQPIIINLLRFAVCLAVVAGLTVGIIRYKSDHEEKETTEKELTEQPTATETPKEQNPEPNIAPNPSDEKAELQNTETSPEKIPEKTPEEQVSDTEEQSLIEAAASKVEKMKTKEETEVIETAEPSTEQPIEEDEKAEKNEPVEKQGALI